MDSAEFGEWAGFYSFEPFGGNIDDIRAGTVAAACINPHRSKGAKALLPLDFFPWAATPMEVEPKTPEAVAMDAFGINLLEIKKSGVKTITIKRPTKE